MTELEIQNKLSDIKNSQRFEKTFDYTRSFVAKAGEANSFAIPMTNEGPFVQESLNIRYTINSTVTPDGGTAKPYNGVKLKFKSQSAGNGQSNDFVPVQLIATPGAPDGERYGARPFFYYYPKGDVLIIEYDNRVPASIAGETYDIKDERIEICFNGKIYPLTNV